LVEIDMFIYTLNQPKLGKVRRREGRYLLRTNLTENDPALLWQYYIQLVAVEQAFKNLKGGSGDPPGLPSGRAADRGSYFHRVPGVLPAGHAAALSHALASGLTARSALGKFAAVQMIDIHLTTDGRELLLTRYTQPEPELQLMIQQLKLQLPPNRLPQSPPPSSPASPDVVKTLSSICPSH
jgi:hypothetical protein